MTSASRLFMRTRNRREVLSDAFRLGGGVFVVTMGARALGLSPAIAKVPEKIVVGQVPFNTVVSLYRSAEVDYFKEEGLSIEYTMAVGGPALVQALAAGSIPAADIGVAPALIAAARKLPLISPALAGIGTPKQPFTRIMVRGDSPIRSVAELKGKRLAVHQRGAMEDLTLPALKASRGIGAEDVEIALVPAPNQPQALAEKQVDAIFVNPPIDAVAERKFKARTLINVAEYVPYIGYNTFTFRKDFVETYPDAAKGLMKGWLRTCRWIDDNQAKARAVMGATLGIDEELRPHVRLPYFARNGLAVLPNVWNIYYMLVANKVLDGVDDPAKLIEQSVIEPVRRIGLPALDAVGRQTDPEVAAMLRAHYPFLPKPVEAYQTDWERMLLQT